jgi:hypothetical protein
MNGEKRHGESRNGNEQVNWDCCVSICLKYGGGGLDFTFNALLIEEFAKGISGPGFSLHSDIVALFIEVWN